MITLGPQGPGFVSRSNGAIMVGVSGGQTPVGGNVVDHVADFIRAAILAGRYAPGHRLVEPDLMRELRVSRGPIRESLRRLAAEGLVEVVPNRGALVRRLSLREATELFQLRMAIEALAVSLATENIKNKQIRRRFEQAISLIWSQEERLNWVAYSEENRIFHEAIIEFSGNEQLRNLSNQMHFPLLLFRTITGSETLGAGHFKQSVGDHQRIATLMLEGKAQAAEAEMRRHVASGIDLLKSLPKSAFRLPA